MADDYVPQPYPKWLSEHGLTVQSQAEEAAVLDGTAVLQETRSAAGSTFAIVGIKPKEEGKKNEQPVPVPRRRARKR